MTVKNPKAPPQLAPHSHGGSAMDRETLAQAYQKGLQLLEKASLKKTKGREALLRVLIEQHGPFSVDELHSCVKKQKLDLVTVYRCLTTFESIGLARRCDFGDGIARYEILLDSSHHHHVICTVCRKAENIEDCEVEQFEKSILARGYTQISHHLEFFGVCENCSKPSARAE